MELVLTGRYADARIVEIADDVIMMGQAEHGYQGGMVARQGSIIKGEGAR